MTTRSRNPTNTLIITNVSAEILNSPDDLVEFLSEYKFLIEFVALTKLSRIIVVCESTRAAIQIKELLSNSLDWNHLRVSYSLKDNYFTPLDSTFLSTLPSDKDFLELPAEAFSKRFLISPPLSPPPEWDYWDKVEDGPNQNTIHAPTDLSHLLWERLGGFDSSNVVKYQDDDPSSISASPEVTEMNSEVLFKDIDNGVPAIVLDSVKNRDNCAFSMKRITKTAMPPPNLNL